MNRSSPATPNPWESLSALADGQLQGEDLAQALAACEQDPALLTAWRDYHLVGEVLRAPAAELPLIADESAFLHRLHARMERLDQEAAPARLAAKEPMEISRQASAAAASAAAANDSRFAWKAVAGLAFMVAVGSLGWNMWGDSGDAGPELAQISERQPVWVQSAQGSIERDARLDELLAAHRELGGASALQVPAGYLRNATFDLPAASAAGR